jgi:DNA-binding beta-propeller fold protein YncE
MMGHVDQTSPLVRDSRNRRFRIAVVLVSVVAAAAGSVALAMRDSSEKTTRTGVALALSVPGHPGAVVAGSDELWVGLSGDGQSAAGDERLQRLDLSTGVWAPPVNLGGEISHLARVGDRLIASVQHVSGLSQLASLDWRTGVVSTPPHWFDPPVDQVVARGSELWALATRPGRLLRLDSMTLAPVSAVRLSPGRALGLAAGAGYLWVTASDDGDVLRIDPKTHAVKSVHVGGFPVGIVVIGGRVWVADRDGGEVVRLDARSLRRVGQPIAVGTKPSGLVAARGSLFVTDQDDGTIVRIAVRSGKRIGLPIRIASPANDAPAPSMARVGQSIWASSFASRTLDRIDPTAAPDDGGGKLTVRVTHANDQQQGDKVINCGVAGIGRFTASGAISEQGKVVVYRCRKGPLITLRFVTLGSKGMITYLVKIDTNNTRTPARWTITSATKGYKGIRGEGIERENPPHFTVQTLIGRVAH